jgi:hypothetical protein
MSDAICPDHGTPLRPGKFGPFCPTKNPDGSWCKFKPGKGTPKPAAPVAPPSSATPEYLLVIAALDFAGKVYQGSGDPTSALEAAAAALEKFKGSM